MGLGLEPEHEQVVEGRGGCIEVLLVYTSAPNATSVHKWSPGSLSFCV